MSFQLIYIYIIIENYFNRTLMIKKNFYGSFTQILR